MSSFCDSHLVPRESFSVPREILWSMHFTTIVYFLDTHLSTIIFVRATWTVVPKRPDILSGRFGQLL